MIHVCMEHKSVCFIGCSYMLHSAINPFLYSLYSKRFRNGIHDYIKSKSQKTTNFISEDSLDLFIKSFNFGQVHGKETKRVTNKVALQRHFNFHSAEINRNSLLRKDMVVIHRGDSDGLTRFNKFGYSLKSDPLIRSIVLSTSRHDDSTNQPFQYPDHLGMKKKKRQKEIPKTNSLGSVKMKLHVQKLECGRRCESEGI